MLDYDKLDLLNEVFGGEDCSDPYQPKITKKSKVTFEKTTKKKAKAANSEQLFSEKALAIAACKAAGKEINPFLYGLEFDIKKSNGEKLESEKVFDCDGNQIETRHSVIKLVDTSKFVKIYPEMLAHFFDLSSTGKNVLALVFQEIQENDGKDTICLPFNEECTFVKKGEIRKMSRATFYRGISELVELNFIARSKVSNNYFINPNFIFNGNRVTFCQTFIMRNLKQD